MIAAEQYASRLVVPTSQQTKPLNWPSHKDIALKALAKLAGPHIAPTLKALKKAIAKAEREHREALRRSWLTERRADTNPATAEANADVLAEAASEQQQEETGTDDPAVPLASASRRIEVRAAQRGASTDG